MENWCLAVPVGGALEGMVAVRKTRHVPASRRTTAYQEPDRRFAVDSLNKIMDLYLHLHY